MKKLVFLTKVTRIFEIMRPLMPLLNITAILHNYQCPTLERFYDQSCNRWAWPAKMALTFGKQQDIFRRKIVQHPHIVAPLSYNFFENWHILRKMLSFETNDDFKTWNYQCMGKVTQNTVIYIKMPHSQAHFGSGQNQTPPLFISA